MAPGNEANERSFAAQRRWQAEVAKETLSIQEVAALLDPGQPDPARVAQFAEAGELLGVLHEGVLKFPKYQFSGADIREAIPELMALAKHDGIPPWDVAYWMISPSSLFAAQDRPMDRLDDPDELLIAARYEFETIW